MTESPRHETFHFLFILTLIQFWWIAIWGLAYILIELVAGPSKTIECVIYILMLVITMYIIHLNPRMLDRL